jgi:hypothetical protein
VQHKQHVRRGREIELKFVADSDVHVENSRLRRFLIGSDGQENQAAKIAAKRRFSRSITDNVIGHLSLVIRQGKAAFLHL